MGNSTQRATTDQPVRDVAAKQRDGEHGRRRRRSAGLLLVAAPVMWLLGAAAFMSRVKGFYEQYDSDPVRAVNSLAGQQAAWVAQSLLFFTGTALAVVGLVLLAQLLKRGRGSTLAAAGVVVAAAVLVLNLVALVLRLAAPTDGVRTQADVPALLIPLHTGWLNLLTVALTLVMIALFAAALARRGDARWIGAVVVVLSALVLVGLLRRGSLPPVAVYPLAGLLGLRLLVGGWGPASPEA